MRIAVCIKQVPAGVIATNPLDGTLRRSETGNTINPHDPVAIELALQIKNKTGGHLSALTMGPPSAVEVLRTALAMGADEALHISDPVFAGSDVYATAAVVSQVIRAYAFDIIVCGQQTTDGDTAQFPFSLAAQLGFPSLGFVKRVTHISKKSITTEQEVTGGVLTIQTPLPVVIACTIDCLSPHIPALPQRLGAKKIPIRTIGLADLTDANECRYGLAGSPTRVRKIFAPPDITGLQPLCISSQQAADVIKKELKW